MPGEEFSYNNAIGPTTPEAGYKPGAAYIGGKVVTDYGGGVCQTSSTLYNAALLSNLEITSEGTAIIPTEWKTEIYCYEFKGIVDNKEFLVYINTETGKEEDVLVIIDTPGGILTT